MLKTQTATDARSKMTARIASLTTDQILQAVVAIGGGYVSEDQRMVRAYLLDEFERREGGDMLDDLMDRVGL